MIKDLIHRYLLPYRLLFVGALGCMVISALATAALPYFLKPVFDELFRPHSPMNILVLSGIVFLIFIFKGLGGYGESVILNYIGQKIITHLQLDLLSNLLRLDLSFFRRVPSGELISRFNHDVGLMRNALTYTVIGLGRDFLTLVFLVGVMFKRDVVLALVTFFIFPALIIPITQLGRRIRRTSLSNQDETAGFTHILNQILQNIRLVKAYTQEASEFDRTKIYLQKIFKTVERNARLKALGHPIVELVCGMAIIGIIMYGGFQVTNQTKTPGDFLSFIGALLFAYEPLKRLSHLNASLQEGLSASNRILSLINEVPSIQGTDTLVQSSAFGRITFENVTFSYQDNLVLDQVSFDVLPGQTIAFVGPSGGGKSTIINLIPRFFDTQSGQIFINEVDIKNWPLSQLRQTMALVSQEVGLFDRSIADNIAYGRPGATQKEIEQAAIQAAAHDFILGLPDGYETMIGENGVRLSGGQRQRIAIARAFLKNAPILLLDEATSALDAESENLVQQALNELMSGRTTVLVAHRFSTIMNADRIYVIDQGRIVAQGSHAELLSRETLYRELWNFQKQGIDG